MPHDLVAAVQDVECLNALLWVCSDLADPLGFGGGGGSIAKLSGKSVDAVDVTALSQRTGAFSSERIESEYSV